MLKQEYTIEELIKAEEEMDKIVMNKFMQFVSNPDKNSFLENEYKPKNIWQIEYVVSLTSGYARYGTKPDAVDDDLLQSIQDRIKFSLDDVLFYIDDPVAFERNYRIELVPHALNLEHLNENSVMEFAERGYIKQIMKKYYDNPEYDYETAIEDMAELLKIA